jgi:hypothetical protein
VIRYTGNKGAWLRLAPHPKEVSCAMALLLAYPTTASKIMQEWSVIGNQNTCWYFPPTLLTEMFLQNVPVVSVNSETVLALLHL